MYNDKNFKTAHPLTFGLSLTAGTGIVLMITALALGVMHVAGENTSALGMIFALGVVLTVIGIGGWLSVTRPFTHFDDINQPVEDDHGHAAHGDDHAIVPHDDHSVSSHESH